MMVRWKGPWGRGRRGALTVVAMGVLGLTVVVAAANAGQLRNLTARTGRHGSDTCRVPRLTGLTLAKARALAARAGCQIRVSGAPILTLPPQQHVHVSGSQGQRRIARQAPRAGREGHPIKIWLVAECAEQALPGPPAGEPFVTVGPTELISGLYLGGGPFLIRPGPCRQGVHGAGTIAVISPTTGATVARATVASGQLATIPLAPGSYTIEGTFADATVNGVPIQSAPQTVTIPAGMTVRQDVGASVP